MHAKKGVEHPRPASRTTPRLHVAFLSRPTASPSAASAVTAEIRQASEPLLSVESVVGVVAGGTSVLVLSAVAVAIFCRYRSRERGTYNVDAVTVNGYAYEICTTSSSAGSASTTTIGMGTRRKARAAAAADPFATSPSSSLGGGINVGRKAGKRKKKVVREWHVYSTNAMKCSTC